MSTAELLLPITRVGAEPIDRPIEAPADEPIDPSIDHVTVAVEDDGAPIDICKEGDQALIDAVERAPEGRHAIQNPDGSILRLYRASRAMRDTVIVSTSDGRNVDTVSIGIERSPHSTQPVSANVVKWRPHRSVHTAANRAVFGNIVHMDDRNITSPQYAACLKRNIAQQVEEAADQIERTPLIVELTTLLNVRLEQELENLDNIPE